MRKKTSIILRIISWIPMILIVLLALLMVGGRFFGLQMYTVLSPSMEPEYPTGSVIYVKAVEPSGLEEGDVITFQLTDNMTATHRIVEVIRDDGSLQFRTKGDANESADASLVSSSRVIGSPVLVIPKLGYFITYIQSPPGIYVVIAVLAAVLFLPTLLKSVFTGDKKKEEKTVNDSR